ncbi:MAG TPA: hypothetical protein VEC37_15130 [Bacillota bacterium]|nr:hypothetical protein [Bacillota bacterium]
MRIQLEKRLAELKTEYDAGQKLILEHETQLVNLRNTMLRISGAIQVLEETLAVTEPEGVSADKAG